MGKRFDTLLFPGGRTRAFTLSYDDGVIQDRRLSTLFDRYGLKCTFNLGYGVLEHVDRKEDENGNVLFDVSKIQKSEVKILYENHEVGGHSLYHSSLNSLGSPYALYEILEDKRQLETLVNKPLSMFAYPFGFYDEKLKDLLKKAGYLGARTVNSTRSFAIPDDFLEWNPTCHHNDEQLFELLDRFLNGRAMGAQLFYLWGHAYEFDFDKNWDRIEKVCETVSAHKDSVWFATNSEIMRYVNAYRVLEYSVDGSMIYNPSLIDVCIQTAFGQTECLKSGEVTMIRDTPL